MIKNNNPHLLAIKAYYGDTKAKRTGIPYMNHILEGLYILDRINATQEAKEAYCLHPIYQIIKNPEESDVYKEYGHLFNEHSVFLAKEYAKVANAYLCKRHYKSENDVVNLSEFKEVNDMLIADKVQNRKDFECNYENRSDKEVFDRSDQLSQYFKNWIKALGLTEIQYIEFKNELIDKERGSSLKN